MEMASDSLSTSDFPVIHKKISLDIKGNRTDIVMCNYDDNLLVMVTQIGCMGTILHARKEADVSIDPTFNIAVVFGKRDEPLLVACARQLIEYISSCGSSKPLVLSLGLKDHSPVTHQVSMILSYLSDEKVLHSAQFSWQGTLKDVIAAIMDNRIW